MPCFLGLSLLCIIPIPEGHNFLITSVVISGKFFVTISFAIIFLYTNELFPTVIRATGLGTCEAFCRDNDQIGGANFEFLDYGLLYSSISSQTELQKEISY